MSCPRSSVPSGWADEGAFSFAFVRFTFTLEDNLSRLVLSWTSADISAARFDQALPLFRDLVRSYGKV